MAVQSGWVGSGLKYARRVAAWAVDRAFIPAVDMAARLQSATSRELPAVIWRGGVVVTEALREEVDESTYACRELVT
ncbi:hypothetical protein HpMS107_16590 [Helicobacter pylori]